MNRLIVNSTINLNGTPLELLPQTLLIFEGGKYENGILIGNHTCISSQNVVLRNLELYGTSVTEGEYNVDNIITGNTNKTLVNI